MIPASRRFCLSSRAWHSGSKAGHSLGYAVLFLLCAAINREAGALPGLLLFVAAALLLTAWPAAHSPRRQDPIHSRRSVRPRQPVEGTADARL